MSRDRPPERQVQVEEVHEFDAPPERVWRAVTTPGLRERWLPDADLASLEPFAVTPDRTASFRLRDSAPPFLESTVTFAVEPGEAGGTRLRIVHELTDARLRIRGDRAANGNTAPLMRAA